MNCSIGGRIVWRLTQLWPIPPPLCLHLLHGMCVYSPEAAIVKVSALGYAILLRWNVARLPFSLWVPVTPSFLVPEMQTHFQSQAQCELLPLLQSINVWHFVLF